ncbi:MAG TPA: alpha/beta hydrolase [Anaerolineae bacterium]
MMRSKLSNSDNEEQRMKKVGQFIAISLGAVGALLPVQTYRRYRHEMDAIRERVRAGSEILKTDHSEIEYAVRGEGAPALVLHGSGGGYDQGLLLGEQVLGDGFRFISVSRFGFLRSTMPEDSSVEAQAALYTTFLDHLRIEKVIVVAGSGGGPSALQFAHDYPDRCSALILVSAMSMPMTETFPIRVMHFIQRSDYVYWMLARFFQSQLLELLGTSTEVYEGANPEERELVQETLDAMHPMSPRRKGTVHTFEIRPLDSVSMGHISVPTLILHAKDDKLMDYKHAEFAHRNIRQSRLISFEAGGHGLLTRVNEVRDHVSRFLETVQEC